ncbi:hypothetical protein AA313_de0208156 [Arthrobotrys entomopaga]|nr:hypothetical protein AA313_de0208156 [Arthrobotrys entomopaga]
MSDYTPSSYTYLYCFGFSTDSTFSLDELDDNPDNELLELQKLIEGSRDADAPAPETELEALERRAMEAMHNVYQMLEEAESKGYANATTTDTNTKVSSAYRAQPGIRGKVRAKGKKAKSPSPDFVDFSSDSIESNCDAEDDDDFDPEVGQPGFNKGNDEESVEYESGTSDDSEGDNDSDGEEEEEEVSKSRKKSKYNLSKYKIRPREKLEKLEKGDLVHRLQDLLNFINRNQDALKSKQLLSCVLRMEDYLYEAKKKTGAVITAQERRDAEDSNGPDPSIKKKTEKVGLRQLRHISPPRAREDKERRVLEQTTPGFFSKLWAWNWSAAKEQGPSGPLSDDTRNFALGTNWTEDDFRRETAGRHPYIDPEVRMSLITTRKMIEQEYEDNQKYIKGLHYHPDDLNLIAIPTLPSNPGGMKPSHAGPQPPEYYFQYCKNLFASIAEWIKKHIVPTDGAAIRFNSKTLLPSISNAVGKLDYFKASDFTVASSDPKTIAERKIKRQIFFQYIFYMVLNESIWKNWIYGYDEDTIAMVLEEAGLTYGQKNTHEGHHARGKWFIENVRRQETTMNQRILNHQIHVATTLRQIFVPLLKPSATDGDVRRMPVVAERELHMIVGDAQALQLMFQSEYSVHMIQFDEPGSVFEEAWMVNAADPGYMKKVGEQVVPGRSTRLSSRDRIALAFQPAVFIETEAEILERVVVI